MRDKIIDAYTVMKIAGELLDELNTKTLDTPYAWALNSLWHDAGKIYIDGIFKTWDVEKNHYSH